MYCGDDKPRCYIYYKRFTCMIAEGGNEEQRLVKFISKYSSSSQFLANTHGSLTGLHSLTPAAKTPSSLRYACTFIYVDPGNNHGAVLFVIMTTFEFLSIPSTFIGGILSPKSRETLRLM
jgi:hypothetical protein